MDLRKLKEDLLLGEKMIRKVKGGFVLVSKTTGRRLSKVVKSRESLKKREKQVQWFKNQKKYKKEHGGRSIPGTRKKGKK